MICRGGGCVSSKGLRHEETRADKTMLLLYLCGSRGSDYSVSNQRVQWILVRLD